MYVSIHTMSFYLRQIFRNLGIGSRVELTRPSWSGKTRRPRSGVSSLADYQF